MSEEDQADVYVEPHGRGWIVADYRGVGLYAGADGRMHRQPVVAGRHPFTTPEAAERFASGLREP